MVDRTSSIILGPDGQPVRRADLAEPQTSQIMQLRHEFQGHPSRGLTPSRLAAILDGAEAGDLVQQCELYEDMEEKDGHIHAEMGKRRGVLLGIEWDILPPESPYAAEKQAAKTVRELLSDIDFESMLFDVTDAIGKGYCCLEIEWQRLDGYWVPKSLTHRPQSWFQIHRGYRQEIRLRDASAAGAPLQPLGWIVHQHKAKSGYLERAGLFRVLVWPYLFKNYSVADLAEFLEIYGIPLRVGTYPPGSSEKEKLTLLRALTSLGHNAAGIVPEGMKLDFHDAATGDPDAFELMISWCERTVSKVILGATLTSQADGKSSTNALGNVHDDVRMDIRDADAKQVAKTLTRDLVYSIAVLNGLAPKGIRRAPRFMFNLAECEDIGTYATALPSLVGLGMRIPRKWAQERLGIPEPEGDDEDVLVASAPALPDPMPPSPATAATTAQVARPRDYMGALAETLATRADQPIAAWMDRIREEVATAESFEDLLARLADLQTGLPIEELGQLLAEGFGAAHRAGISDVQDESGDA